MQVQLATWPNGEDLKKIWRGTKEDLKKTAAFVTDRKL
jgi:hypothetical protein